MLLKNCNEIIPYKDGIGGIWLGNIFSVKEESDLIEKKINTVLTVASDTNLNYSKEITHKIIEANDIPSCKLNLSFEEGADYIEAQRNLGNTIIVHCFAGVSRSTTMIIAYFIKYKKMNYEESIKFIKSKRSIANPNYGFQTQLKKFEKTYGFN